jgi:hypothetical protein
MASLLLFALPLGTVAYAYGGVSPEALSTAGLLLLGTWLLVGAIALWCSAWSRTTAGALVFSYALVAALGYYLAQWKWFLPGSSEIAGTATQWAAIPMLAAANLLVFAWLVMIPRAEPPVSRFWPAVGAWVGTLAQRLQLAAVTLGLSLLMLLSLCLVLFPGMVTALIQIFIFTSAVVVAVRSVDAFGGERARQTLDVLLSTPVPWRVLVLRKAGALAKLTLILLFPALILLLIRALLFQATPAGPLTYGLTSIPVSTGVAWRELRDLTTVQIGRIFDQQLFGGHAMWVYLALSIPALLVAFWEIRWLGLWMGIAVRNRGRASLIALGLLIGWVTIPRAASEFAAVRSERAALRADAEAQLLGTTQRDLRTSKAWNRTATICYSLSPDSVISLCETGSLSRLDIVHESDYPQPPLIILNAFTVLMVHGLVAFLMRSICLWRAKEYLLRA